MDWEILYSEQKKLDDYIYQVKKIDNKDTFPSRQLAFLVEMGELANELRHFKFWSLKPPSSKQIIIEEYVDGLHFLLSIGISLKHHYQPKVKKVHPLTKEEFVNYFLHLFTLGQKDLRKTHAFEELFDAFLMLGVYLDFSEQEIFDHYALKNEKNHKRQETEY